MATSSIIIPIVITQKEAAQRLVEVLERLERENAPTDNETFTTTEARWSIIPQLFKC